MTAPEKYPQPSPEWIARELLGIGLRQMFSRTLARGRPLAKWRIPHLGANVYAELLLLPSLEVVLRVRDDDAGEVLAQSAPDDFRTVDMNAPEAAHLIRRWQEARQAVAPRDGGDPPSGHEQPLQPNPAQDKDET